MQSQVLLIIGGAGDVAQAVVTAALQQGCQPVVFDLYQPIVALGSDKLNTTQLEAGELIADEHGVHYMAVDCADPGAASAAVACVMQQFGRVDALLAAAGQLLLAPVEAITAQQLDACFRANVYANYFAIQAALPQMRAAGFGRVVLLTSDQASHGRLLGSAYGMCKAAILQLARGLTADLAGCGDIRVNAVQLGTVADTAMTLHAAQQLALQRGQDPAAVLADFAAEQPSGQLVDPMRVARWVLRLCGADAADMAGSVVTLDGGLTAVR